MNKDFLWGSATASYQCEGAWAEDGKCESIWDHYLHINDLENGDLACDNYHKYKEDIKLLKEGGQNSYRFSLSWPRIISNRRGDINKKGVEHYRKILQFCHEEGVIPFVTLYHWDLPQYWEEVGGWLNKDTCYAFAQYAKVCFDAFGNLVNNWVTFNEPKWFVMSGYLIGNYPPGHQSVQETIDAAYNVMYANSLGIKAFREGNYQGKIGIVHSFTPVDGVDDTLATRIAMRFADNYCNNWVLDTAAKGEIPFDLLSDLSKEYSIKNILDNELNIIRKNKVDFLGLNYYSRTLVKPYTEGDTCFVVNNVGGKQKGKSKVIIKNWFEQVMHNPEAIYTEWDMEIYPKGLEKGLLQVKQRYHLPVYITENGIGVREDASVDQIIDDYRINYMNDHINAIMNAMDQGVDVRGYFAWSLMDLYSWKNGNEKRYGLISVDYEDNLKRKPKKSYYWYKNVAATQGNIINRKKE